LQATAFENLILRLPKDEVIAPKGRL